MAIPGSFASLIALRCDWVMADFKTRYLGLLLLYIMSQIFGPGICRMSCSWKAVILICSGFLVMSFGSAKTVSILLLAASMLLFRSTMRPLCEE